MVLERILPPPGAVKGDDSPDMAAGPSFVQTPRGGRIEQDKLVQVISTVSNRGSFINQLV